MVIDPDYPHIVLSFTYRGWCIQIDRGEWDGEVTYGAWANYDQGCAVAVPYARSRTEAVLQAKQWVNRRLQGGQSSRTS